MATEVLVNDGGAPCRIIPFTAGSTITAGYALQMGADAQVDTIAGADNVMPIGVAMVDATSGNVVSVITGKGIVLNMFCSGTIGRGDGVATLADGNLGQASASSVAVGNYIDTSGAHSGAATMQQVLWG
jgi:hypothetical protein|tara:strand:- start:1491 stop:1877 length:387 start_codon:yes stop_codon:yes gene_type:complete